MRRRKPRDGADSLTAAKVSFERGNFVDQNSSVFLNCFVDDVEDGRGEDEIRVVVFDVRDIGRPLDVLAGLQGIQQRRTSQVQEDLVVVLDVDEVRAGHDIPFVGWSL